MFTYSECKILSATPLAEIKKYLFGLGAREFSGQTYHYADIKIIITPYTDETLPDLGISRHIIEVSGDKNRAEEFLTAFRFRFMSAGG